jgi:hypothetical protein
MTWIETLAKQHNCSDGLEWAKGYKSFKAAWAECQRGDWMLWFLDKRCKTIAQRKRLVYTACQCARLALPYIQNDALTPLAAIETTERWTREEATMEQVIDAAAAVCATYPCTESTHAPYAAAYAAAAAAYAGEDPSLTAEFAIMADVNKRAATLCADIVRKNHPQGKL